mgnify:CR=1 FL=1
MAVSFCARVVAAVIVIMDMMVLRIQADIQTVTAGVDTVVTMSESEIVGWGEIVGWDHVLVLVDQEAAVYPTTLMHRPRPLLLQLLIPGVLSGTGVVEMVWAVDAEDLTTRQSSFHGVTIAVAVAVAVAHSNVMMAMTVRREAEVAMIILIVGLGVLRAVLVGCITTTGMSQQVVAQGTITQGVTMATDQSYLFC